MDGHVGQHLAVDFNARLVGDRQSAGHRSGPCSRAAALMRWIHSERKLRFFTLRSR